MKTTLTLNDVAHISLAIETRLENLTEGSLSHHELTEIKKRLESEFIKHYDFTIFKK
jgi:hypothetical protein